MSRLVRGSPVATAPADVAALVRELSDHLLHASTATEGLRAWCEARSLGAGPITAVKRAPDRGRHPDDDMLDELRPEGHERIAHRCVRLVRGRLVLADADNWFVADRLPPEVRDLLAATDIPFGTAIGPLYPSRRTFFVRFAEGTGPAPLMTILEHKAVVLDRNRRPLAVVSERYRAALLDGVEAPVESGRWWVPT
jgi:hypothetical protein